MLAALPDNSSSVASFRTAGWNFFSGNTFVSWSHKCLSITWPKTSNTRLIFLKLKINQENALFVLLFKCRLQRCYEDLIGIYEGPQKLLQKSQHLQPRVRHSDFLSAEVEHSPPLQEDAGLLKVLPMEEDTFLKAQLSRLAV